MGGVFSMSMTDEFKPIIRDPQKFANMLQQNASSEALGSTGSNTSTDPVADVLSADEVRRGLAKADPLTRHPRISSIVQCVAFGLMLLAASVGVWWLGVYTLSGQSYEDMVWSKFPHVLPAWLGPVVHIFAISLLVQGVSVAMAIIALIVLIVRKRWLLIMQLAVFGGLCFTAAKVLKSVLPRPYLINLDSNPANSAPSGHTILAAAAGVMLVCAVPRVLRALAAAIGWLYAVLVGLSVIAAQWHRPIDVIMALLIVGGLALLMLAVSFANGMDEPGKRTSSPSVQIVGSVMLTFGTLGTLYGAYIIWQIQPGLDLSAEWTNAGACASTAILTASVCALVFGLVLVMRQLTASPLTKLGLVGAPPAPPKQ